MSDATAERPLESGWLPDTPMEDSVLRGFVFNQADMNELVARSGRGRAERSDDVSLADTGTPVGYLNQAVLLRPVLRGDDPVLDQVERFYGSAGQPSMLLSLWPTPPLEHRGWQLVGHPMFVARAPAPVPGHERPGVRIRDIQALEDIGTFERVLVEGYPMPEGAGEPAGTFFPPAAVEQGLRLRLGMLDGEPVATGAVFVAHGVLNLCGAATLAPARRRGVWQALVWSRISEAPDLPAVAFTSDYSRPGFVRMGFLPITRCTLWLRLP